MSKKPSLAAALQTLDRAAAPPQPAAKKPPSTKGQGSVVATQAPGRVGKKALIGYFDPGVSKQLKQMALDRDSNIQELLSEALNDFFSKHKKPTIA